MTWRVAMVGACPYPVPQGSQVLLRDTARALHEAGHTVHLVVYGHGAGEVDDDFPVHRCRNVPGYRKTSAGPSIAKPLADAFLISTLKTVVREESIEIVHAHNYEGLLVALAARVRPVVYHAHNAMADELPWYFSGRRAARRFGAWLDRTVPKRADRIVVPHQALAEYLISKGCSAEKVSVIPPARVVTDFEEPVYADAPAEVLYTGNLDAYQNLAFLKRAMDIVKATEPEARLVVATATENAAPVRGAEVLRTPDLASLREVLARDVIVACPRVSWSGYPIKILNAMAAGRPVVACRSASGPITYGIDGVTVPDGDAEAFAEAILRLRFDRRLRECLGTAARETIRTLHKPALLARRLERVYAAARKT